MSDEEKAEKEEEASDHDTDLEEENEDTAKAGMTRSICNFATHRQLSHQQGVLCRLVV